MSFCYFCENPKHLSENCDTYATLRSRYSKLKNPIKFCLCNVKKGRCKCKIICKVCLQQHHIALCPKMDPSHRFRIENVGYDIMKLGYNISQRFFALVNPIDKFKLQLTSKYFFYLEPIADFELCKTYPPPSNLKTKKSTIIFNDFGRFYDKNIRFLAAENKNHFFNLRSFTISTQFITKADLQILSYGDPESVQFYQCLYEEGIEFKDILEAFPYATDFMITHQQYFYFPKTWLLDLISAKRFVSYKSFLIIIPEDYMKDFRIEQLVELFDANENLSLVINIKSNKHYYELQKLLTEKFQHTRFAALEANDENEECDLCIKHGYQEWQWYNFNRKS